MIEILTGITLIVIIYVYSIYKANKRQIQLKEERDWERKDQQRVAQSIQNVLEDRKKKPMLCKICTKVKKKKVYFEGISWYHCPKCGGHGLASVYSNSCTNCANLEGIASGRIHL
jgi:hypothetical protein